MTTFLTYQQGGGQLTECTAAILASLAASDGLSDLDAAVVAAGLRNLLLVPGLDDTALRSLALPASLATLRRCAEAGLVSDDDAMRDGPQIRGTVLRMGESIAQGAAFLPGWPVPLGATSQVTVTCSNAALCLP